METRVSEVHGDEVAVRGESSLYPWYVVTVLMLAQTCSFIDRMIMGLLVGPVRATFNISDTQYSLLAGLSFAIFYALMGIPLARIADNKSRRLLIAAGITVWSLMTAMCGLAKGFWGLFFARVGVGVGEASLSPAAYSMITDYFAKHNLAKALSIYTLGVTVGSGLAYMIGGQVVSYVSKLGQVSLPLVGAMHGWQVTFLLVGIPGLMIAALMLTVREPARRGQVQNADGSSQVVPFSEVLQFVLARKMAIGSHVLGVSIYIMVVFGVNVWGPTYLIRSFGYEPGQAGMIFGSIMMFGGTGGLLLGGMLADKWFARGRKDAYSRVIVLSACAMLPFMLILGFTSSPVVGIGVLAVATFFSAFQGGIAGGVIQLLTPNQMRGQVVALYFLVANLVGLGLGPTVVAAMTDYIFADDGAIAQSLALNAAILCPLAVAIISLGMPAVRAAIEQANDWDRN